MQKFVFIDPSKNNSRLKLFVRKVIGSPHNTEESNIFMDVPQTPARCRRYGRGQASSRYRGAIGSARPERNPLFHPTIRTSRWSLATASYSGRLFHPHKDLLAHSWSASAIHHLGFGPMIELRSSSFLCPVPPSTQDRF